MSEASAACALVKALSSLPPGLFYLIESGGKRR